MIYAIATIKQDGVNETAVRSYFTDFRLNLPKTL